MTSLTSFPAAPSLPCSPWKAKWKRERKKKRKKKVVNHSHRSVLHKRNKIKLCETQRNSGTDHRSRMPGGSWWPIHAMKTSLTSGSLLTFDALKKENIKDIEFSLSVIFFNCSYFPSTVQQIKPFFNSGNVQFQRNTSSTHFIVVSGDAACPL